MSRARATALALVNWKGVFYERYQLDRHVTALEGANGAGKTTVMIAAYVVLLPDMSKLRFTNLGETAASGGDRGIWGRLGEPSRPAYAAIELDVSGERLVAGVMLTRKSEPTVELTPFLVSGLAPTVRLQDLLLLTGDEQQAVPDLGELRENAARLSVKLEVFGSARDYFSALFELGVGALRLASDEERGKLSDMLRTSMTGGISRAITSELRTFLLREQTGLGDTLGRMRANLDACRRTRSEVADARLLEQEMSGVHEAGQSMFSSALLACRERSRALRALVKECERACEVGRAELTAVELELAQSHAREASVSSKLDERRRERAARSERTRTAQVRRSLSLRAAELGYELEGARAVSLRAEQRQAALAQERETARAKRLAAREAQERAALGLAHLQRGMDELYARAAAFRQAVRARKALRELLQEPEIEANVAIERASELESELLRIDRTRLAHERTLKLAELRRSEWHEALAALAQLGMKAPADSAFEAAQHELARLARLEAGLASRAELEQAFAESSRMALQQIGARALASELDFAATADASTVRAELSRVEAELAGLEQQAREQEQRVRLAQAEFARASQAARSVAERAERYEALAPLAAKLELAGGPFARSREALLRLRDSLNEERTSLRERVREQSRTREELLREASHYEAAGGRFSNDLLKLRDDLDGELLASRFEDLEPSEAGRTEALLGPLSQALVVDDLEQATRQLSAKGREFHEVRLVASGSQLDLLQADASQESDGLLIVNEGGVRRIARIPERPSLGRRARALRVTELRKSAVELGERVEQAQARLRLLDGVLLGAETLLVDAAVLEAGDPSDERARSEAAVTALESAVKTAEGELMRIRGREPAQRARLARLQTLLGDAYLLEAEDHGRRKLELKGRLAELAVAKTELEERSAARRLLEQRLEGLRTPPPSELDLARFDAERSTLAAERDRLVAVLDALRELKTHAPALGYEDAERALSSQISVVPALEAQHAAAHAAVVDAETALGEAEHEWERSVASKQTASAAQLALEAHLLRVHEELGALAGAPTSEDEDARHEAELDEALGELEREARDVLSEQGRLAERVRQAKLSLEAKQAAASAAARDAGPAEERWRVLEARAREASLLRLGPTAERAASELELWAEARSRRALLVDRLHSCRGGEALARDLAALPGDDEAAYGDVWLRVRDFLSRRVPAQVAEEQEPLLALERLRDHLGLLEQRLLHQEGDLRGASEDVARGIEVHLRRARSQVRRLNQSLQGTSFGSIAGIRVELGRVKQMEPVLRALGEGSAQELLFQSNLPIEDALSEILRRWGGGRAGGQRILDYREYIELTVEVQRRLDSSWEVAHPTRLSTGEAIGVGAALMMVVLTEWERDANLLRPRRGPGSLRFLFLDEANRLSQDNLGVLFDLCKSLDLQLLIAAPEVARAEGNTTYRLVRRVTEDGREEVIVSGRRAPQIEPEPKPLAVAPSEPVQRSLF